MFISRFTYIDFYSNHCKNKVRILRQSYLDYHGPSYFMKRMAELRQVIFYGKICQRMDWYVWVACLPPLPPWSVCTAVLHPSVHHHQPFPPLAHSVQ